MKFDSYPRFIKSELYKECLLREISGQELPFNGSAELDQGLKLERPNKVHSFKMIVSFLLFVTST